MSNPGSVLGIGVGPGCLRRKIGGGLRLRATSCKQRQHPAPPQLDKRKSCSVHFSLSGSATRELNDHEGLHGGLWYGSLHEGRPDMVIEGVELPELAPTPG